MMTDLIVVPYNMGVRGDAVGAGPLEIQSTGIADRIGAQLFEVDLGSTADWMRLNDALAARVRHTRQAGAFPLILAGNCNSCVGTLAGFAEPQTGVFWFDAHGDFHTPETSLSGSLEGMSLTLATTQFVAAERVVLVGGRDLDRGEDDRVRTHILHIPDGDLAGHTLPPAQNVYVHIDVDVLDPTVSPGANFQGPGGLNTEQLYGAVKLIFDRYDVAALAITNYNPARDVSWITRDLIAQLVGDLARLRRASSTR